MKYIVYILCFCLFSTAHAQTVPYVISDYEVTDSGGTASFEFVEGGTTSAVTSITGSKCHDADNGGSSTSNRCLKFTPAAGQTAYARMQEADSTNITMGTNTGVVTRCYHIETFPSSGSVTLGEWVESDASRGVYLIANSDHTLEFKYGTTSLGSTFAIEPNVCSSSQYLTCADANDCPGSDTCPTCTATGSNCYYACVESVVQNSTSVTDTVQVDAWINGSHILVGSPVEVSGLATMDDWIDGAVTDGAGTGGAVYYVDSARTGDGDNAITLDSSRLGWGPVHTAIGTTQTNCSMKDTNCDTSNVESCIDEFESGGTYDSNGTQTQNTAKARNAGASGDSCTMYSASLPAYNGGFGALSIVSMGRTSNDTFTYTVGSSLAYCPNGSCVYGDEVVSPSLSDSTSHLLMHRATFTDSPSGSDWDQTTIDNIGYRFRYKSETVSAAVIRLGALVLYAAENNPDDTEDTTLPDVDSNGIHQVCIATDSTGKGNFSVSCTTSTDLCGGLDYCAWNDTKGITCGGDDAACRTCSATRTENGGLGWPCDGTTYLCSNSTCDTAENQCTDNTNIPCTINADCENLGTCPDAADAKCLPQCPDADGDVDPNYDSCTTDADCEATETCASVHGSLKCIGDCPISNYKISSWSQALCSKLGSDVNCVSCSQDGSRMSDTVLNRWPGIKAHRNSTCKIVRGDGNCYCTGDSDCEVGTCNGSGICASESCVESDDCITGICDFLYQCDVLFVWDDLNTLFAPVAPECTGLAGRYVPSCANGVAETTCNDNGDCSSLGDDSICYGWGPAVTSYGKWCTKSGAEDCSAANGNPAAGMTFPSQGSCNSNSDCESNLCWDGAADPLGQYHLGFCGCATTANCPLGYSCVDADLGAGGVQGICRLDCSSDSDCPSAETGSCVSSTCLGHCSAPCSKDSCSVDEDCPVYTGVGDYLGWVSTMKGACVSGSCAHCGTSPCPDHGALVATNTDQLTHDETIRGMEYLRKDIDTMTYPPIIVTSTTPLMGSLYEVCYDSDFDQSRWNWPHPQIRWNNREAALHNAKVIKSHPDPDMVCDLQTYYNHERSPNGETWNTDGVHLTVAGATWISDKALSCLLTINTCVVTDSNGNISPQKYCKYSGGFRTEACDLAADCSTVGDSCSLHPCSSDGDCTLSSPADTCNVVP